MKNNVNTLVLCNEVTGVAIKTSRELLEVSRSLSEGENTDKGDSTSETKQQDGSDKAHVTKPDILSSNT